MNINEHITREVLNEFSGSEEKRTVYLDDGKKYLLKLSDRTREEDKRQEMSYINNAISEYLGCKIYKSVGIPVQNVILGEFTKNGNTRLACLCEDVRQNETMHEIDKLRLSDEFLQNSSNINKDKITFDLVNAIINEIPTVSDKDKEEIKNFYYNMFIIDAFIGNTDRHNGNWAILSKDGEFSRISPVYDCGSSLLPMISDDELGIINLRVESANVVSVVYGDDGKRINYENFFKQIENIDVRNALIRNVGKINLEKINDIVEETPYISTERKAFYEELLEDRYNKILIPALEKIYPIEKKNEYKGIDLYDIYLKNIKQISELTPFEKTTLKVENCEFEFQRVNKKYALIMENEVCVGLLPIRSNNDEIKKAIEVFSRFGIDITKMQEQQEENIISESLNKDECTEKRSDDGILTSPKEIYDEYDEEEELEL